MLYESSTASKIAPDLGHVQETLLIPLYARARDATRRHPVLHDERAAALVDSLEYDFSRSEARRCWVAYFDRRSSTDGCAGS
jgi:O-methyltransferase involved in polyketide biosynthesis